MPRKARIDAPGALHHIICRGINRQNIFHTDIDRKDFVNRFGQLLDETQTRCYAWALMPNHIHLLLRTVDVPISILMRRLLTGYAVSFNKRHQRSGHLFQNRYKSILCQEENYLLELVRYIHLNPFRAGLVASLKELDYWAFSGQGVLMGSTMAGWQDTHKILGLFGSSQFSARKQYQRFVGKGVELGRRPDLIGGGLVRSAGGWQAVKAMRRSKEHARGDERILGDSDFVIDVLKRHDEQLERQYRLQAEGYDFEMLLDRVSAIFSLSREEIIAPGRTPLKVKARSVVCHWAVKELKMTATHVGQLLGIGQPSVSRAAVRGEKVVREMKMSMFKS